MDVEKAGDKQSKRAQINSSKRDFDYVLPPTLLAYLCLLLSIGKKYASPINAQ